MADVLITPASGKVEFKDGSNNIDGKIELDGSGNLNITAPGGDLVLGDTTSDIFIGNGVNNIDIVFEQSGEIRGTSGTTLTIGSTVGDLQFRSNSNISVNNEFQIASQGGIDHVAHGIDTGNTFAHRIRTAWTAGFTRWYMYPIKDGASQFGREFTYDFDNEYWSIEGTTRFPNGLVSNDNLTVCSTLLANNVQVVGSLTLDGTEVLDASLLGLGTVPSLSDQNSGSVGDASQSYIVFDSTNELIFHKDVSNALNSPVGAANDADMIQNQVFKMVGNVFHKEGHITGATTLTLDFTGSQHIDVVASASTTGALDIRADSITADRIKAGAISADKLSVKAVNFVNPVSFTETLNGWGGADEETGTGVTLQYLTYDAGLNALELANNISGGSRADDIGARSDTWQLDDNKIYKVTFRVSASSSGAISGGWYVGIAGFTTPQDGTVAGNSVSGSVNFIGYGTDRTVEATTTSLHFVENANKSEVDAANSFSGLFTCYVIGKNRTVEECPDHYIPTTSGSAIRPYLKDAGTDTTYAALRLLNWNSGTSLNQSVYFKDITVTELGTGVIVADNIKAGAIETDKLAASAITADKIQANSINATKIAASSITGTEISATAKIVAGTGNNVGVLDGADSTYRIYAGNATAGSAPFRVTQSGALIATNATISGSITATTGTFAGTLSASSGTIGGWTIDSSTLFTGTKDVSGYTSTGISINGSGNGSFHSKNFYIDTSGNAFFKGSLAAASGTFSGTLTAQSISAGNIQAGEIKTSLLTVGSRTTINPDPTFQDLDEWNGGTLSVSSDYFGENVIKIEGNNTTFNSQTYLPIEENSSYRVKVLARGDKGVATGGGAYLHVDFLDVDRVRINNSSSPTSDATGWLSVGTYHYYGISNGVLSNSTWTVYQAQFGPKEDKSIPTGARFMRIGGLFNRTVSPTRPSGDITYLSNYQLIKMSDETIITNSSIATKNIFAGAITTDTLAASAIIADKIEADAITAGKITASAVTADKIQANSITTVKIAASAVTANEIEANSINATKIAASSITGTEIASATTITAGSGNNVGVLDGADATYRIYAGNATPASAPFRVTQSGALIATNATISGSVSMTTGTISDSVTIGGGTAGDVPTGDNYTTSVNFNPDMTIVDGDGRPAGVKAVYNSATPGNISYLDAAKTVVKLASATDTTIGAGWPAFRVNPDAQYNIVVRWKSNTTSASGVYLRIQEADGDTLGTGNTHISNNAGSSEPGVIEDSRQSSEAAFDGMLAPEYENLGITTSYATEEFVYTPSSTAKWASVIILNWSGLGTNELHIDKLYVTEDTSVKSQGSVGGWTIDSEAIFSGTKNTTGTGYATAGVTIRSASGASIHAEKFYIDKDGNASFKGNLDAASGTFSGNLTAQSISAGNITASAITATKIDAAAITTDKLAASAITAGKIDASAITAGKIDASAITAVKIDAAAITTNKLAASAITAGKIDASAITAGKIDASAITAVKIDAGAVTTDKLAASAITAGKIDASAITAGKIDASAITAVKIDAGAVTADKIAASAITATKIDAGAVTTDKLTAGVAFPSEGQEYYWPCDAKSEGGGYTYAIYEVINNAYSEIQGTSAANVSFSRNSPSGKAINLGLNVGVELLDQATAAALETTAGFAWGLWFKSTNSNAGTSNRIIGRDVSDGWAITIDQSASSQTVTLNGQSGTSNVTTSLGNVDVQTWHHVVFSHDGNNTLTGYIDGELIGTVTYTGENQSRPVALGCNTEGTLQTGSSNFRGFVTDIRAYSRPLNLAEVRAIYNAVGLAAEIHGNMLVNGTITGSEISSATTITAGTGDNVGVLDGADATYRIYAGNATPASAPFRVTQSGELTATNATITGNITATSGTFSGTLSGASGTFSGTLTAQSISAGNITASAITADKIESNTIDATKIVVGGGIRNDDDQYNLVDPRNWTAGTGAATGFGRTGTFNRNGQAIENTRLYDINPFGNESLIWRAGADATTGADGGWNCDFEPYSIDETLMYVCYYRRTGTTPDGNFYLGTTQATGGTETLAGSATTNPYFFTPTMGTLPLDVWCVGIGILYGASTTTTSNAAIGGVYRCDTGEKIASATSFRIQSGYDGNLRHRAYLFNSENTTNFLDFYAPGVYRVNGAEPTLSQLLDGGAAVNAGTTTIDGGSITTNTITATQLAASIITATEIQASAITAIKIDAGAVTADKIAASAITAVKIDAGAIIASKIAASAITAAKIDANAVTADKIAASAITATKIDANAVTAEKIEVSNNQAGSAGIYMSYNGGNSRIDIEDSGGLRVRIGYLL